MSRLRTRLLPAFLVLCARPASAHIVASRLGDFYAGVLHPLTDLQDIVLWVALGLLAGALDAARGRWLVVLFPLGLLAGLALGLMLDVGAIGAISDAAAMILVGLLLAASVRLPGPALIALALGLAVMRGAVNAGGVGPETNRLLFAAGLAGVGYAAITLVMAAALAFHGDEARPQPAWHAIALRALGGWIAAIGLMMGGFALAS